MALDLRKPHERYGSAYGTLIWQEGELFDKTGKLLPKDPQDLMNMGYRLPVPLRKRLFMYAHERRMDSELAARRKALEAEYQAMEQAFRDNLNKLSAAALSSEVVQPVMDYPPPPPPPLIPYSAEELEAGRINDELDALQDEEAVEEVVEAPAPVRRRRARA